MKKLNNGISSIAHETKIIVEKGSTFISECTLDVHGYIKGNIKGKFVNNRRKIPCTWWNTYGFKKRFKT